MSKTHRYVFVALVIICLSIPVMGYGAGQRPSVMLILDGSGSMWGEVDGRDKIAIARNVAGDLVDQWPSGIDIGLMAYGHRRKGDCGDIETLVSPGPLKKNQFLQKVQSIRAANLGGIIVQ